MPGTTAAASGATPEAATPESRDNSTADSSRFPSYRLRKKSQHHQPSSPAPAPPAPPSASQLPSSRRSLLLRLFFAKRPASSASASSTSSTTPPSPPSLTPATPTPTAHPPSTPIISSNPLFSVEPFDLNLLFKDDDHVNYSTSGAIMVRNKHFVFDGDVLTFSASTTTAPLTVTPNAVLVRDTVRLFQLGKGSSSTVWACLDTDSFRVFAVKETRILDSVHPVRQAQNEIQALEQLRGHANVCQLLAAYINPHSCSICLHLDYCLGGSVAQLILQRGSRGMDERVLRRIARDVGSALASTHQLGMAHCDVKPANILIARDYSRFVLCDFGLARACSAVQPLVSFTGTTRYMSPERLLGLPYGAPADVWSLGLVLCACAHGRYPLTLVDGGAATQATHVLGEEAVFFAVLQHVRECGESKQTFSSLGGGGDYSAEAEAFCRACLNLKPQDRPTAQELVDDFAWGSSHDDEASGGSSYSSSNAHVLREVCDALQDKPPALKLEPRHVAQLAQQFNLPEPAVQLQLEAALSGGAQCSPPPTAAAAAWHHHLGV